MTMALVSLPRERFVYIFMVFAEGDECRICEAWIRLHVRAFQDREDVKMKF